MERYVYNISKDDISIDKTELALRLKTPSGYTDNTVEKCIKQVFDACSPKGCYVRVPVNIVGEDKSDFEFASLRSYDLCKTLSGCKEGYIMAVTLGIEADRLINRMSLVSKTEGFIADAAASAMTESVLDVMNGYLKEFSILTPRFSPGYGDLDLSCQRVILDALGADKNLGIKLGENLIMTPRKSITAICGIKE